MKCPRCGTEYNSPFCPRCGLSGAPATPPAPQKKKKLRGCLLSFIVTAGASLLLVVCIAVGMMNAIIQPSAAVSAAFAIPVVICLLGTVVSGIIFIVMSALKKHRLVTGLLWAGFGGAFILFTALGVMTSPATWCEHEFKVINERAATCTEDGEIVRLCALCDTEQTETVKALGHNMIEVSRDEREIVTRCSVCGYEEIAVIEVESDTISPPASISAPPASISLPASEPAPIPTHEEANLQFIEIREAYENNELSADDKYKGNRYVIYAYLNGITEDGLINLFGGITATVEMRINGTLYFAYCTFGEESRDVLAALNKGDLMIIEGECLSWGQWADCVLLP